MTKKQKRQLERLEYDTAREREQRENSFRAVVGFVNRFTGWHRRETLPALTTLDITVGRVTFKVEDGIATVVQEPKSERGGIYYPEGFIPAGLFKPTPQRVTFEV